MKIDVPFPICTIIERLNLLGFSAYAVGGCVRDCILKRQPKDWDITTSAHTNEVKSAFREYAVIDTGIAHGTVSVIINHKPYEITTFRADGGYSDNRRPDYVKFVTNVEDDLSRRDFTVNAMAYDYRKEKVIDLFGGVRDIENRIIRCVGEPSKRFNEDALRILRGLRFASVLEFEIEPETSEAIKSNRELLKNISAERIFSELKQLICGAGAERILREYRDVFAVVIPEIEPMFDFRQNNPYHCYDVWEHTLHGISNVPQKTDLRIAMLFHDIGKPETHTEEHLEGGGMIDHFYSHADASELIARKALRRLKSDNDLRRTVALLVKHHGIDLSPSKKIIKRRLNKFGEPILRKLISVKRADVSAQSSLCREKRLKQLDETELLLEQIISESECFSIKNLEINGNDVVSMGYTGRDVGIILNKVVDEVISEKLENRKEVLLEYIGNNFK